MLTLVNDKQGGAVNKRSKEKKGHINRSLKLLQTKTSISSN